MARARGSSRGLSPGSEGAPGPAGVGAARGSADADRIHFPGHQHDGARAVYAGVNQPGAGQSHRRGSEVRHRPERGLGRGDDLGDVQAAAGPQRVPVELGSDAPERHAGTQLLRPHQLQQPDPGPGGGSLRPDDGRGLHRAHIDRREPGLAGDVGYPERHPDDQHRIPKPVHRHHHRRAGAPGEHAAGQHQGDRLGRGSRLVQPRESVAAI